jgi:hypothetical protein
MAKKEKKNTWGGKRTPRQESPNPSSSLLTVPPIPKGEFFVIDEDEIPLIGFFGRSVEISYPKEFAAIDAMKVHRSGVFLTEKLNVINAIRSRLHKLAKKKFQVKKINTTHSRIWRVADNAVTRVGGRAASIKAGKTNSERAKAKGPKQNKNGQAIVPPVNNEVTT